MAIIDELTDLKSATLNSIAQAADTSELEAVRVSVLGKKGTLTAYLRGMGQLAPEDRATVGKTANEVRNAVESALEARKAELASAELVAKMDAEAVDITLPGRVQQMGTRHLISGIIDEISDIFLGMGYSVARGPEVETDYYNFAPRPPACRCTPWKSRSRRFISSRRARCIAAMWRTPAIFRSFIR